MRYLALFCFVNIDGLLKALHASGVGRSISSSYTGVLDYADDILPLSLTANARDVASVSRPARGAVVPCLG